MEKINDDYYLTMKKNKLVNPKNDVYETFISIIKYIMVIAEPEYSEYN